MKTRERGFVSLIITQAASNTCTSTNTFVVVWLMSAPSLPGLLLGLNQVIFLVTLMLGTRLNPMVVHRLGLRRSAILLLAAEGCALACLGIWLVISAAGLPTFTGAIGLVGLAGVTTLIAGMNGPSWVTIVARWGGDVEGRQRRLMADSAAFQFAAAAGPFLGSLLIAWPTHIWLLPVLNVATNAAAAVVVGLGIHDNDLAAGPSDADSPSPRGDSPGRGSHRLQLLRTLRALPPLTLVVLAAFIDPLRTVVPLLVRGTGGTALTLAATSAALAVAAALATLLATDHPMAVRANDRMQAGGTLIALGTGALLWLFCDSVFTFVAGGLLVGIGAATLYGQLMAAAADADRRLSNDTQHVAGTILLRAAISSVVAFVLTGSWGNVARNIAIILAFAVLFVGWATVIRNPQRGVAHDSHGR
ncbi:hypothetical protein [Arthrobacter woluwensis]|uniref:hypothetical protein n=1 Tax=Arthrobacter woluwensis TaxID=156980 RepID=UPI00382AA192